MVRNVTGDEVQAGQRFALQLNGQTPVSVAFWNYEPDHERWRLILGVNAVDRFGMMPTLKRAQVILMDTKLTLDDLRILGMKDSIAAAVGKYLPHQQEGYYPEINNVVLGEHDIRRAIVLWTTRPVTQAELSRREALKKQNRMSGVSKGLV